MENANLRDDISLYNFMFEDPASTSNDNDQSWFIDAETGEVWTKTQIQRRTDSLALGLQASFSLGVLPHSLAPSHPGAEIRDVVSIVSPNCVDFAPIVWASHKLGCTVSPSNASGTPEELQ